MPTHELGESCDRPPIRGVPRGPFGDERPQGPRTDAHDPGKGFTQVTNNAIDFRRIFQHDPIHAGLGDPFSERTSRCSRALLATVLEYVGDRDLVNTAVEIDLKGDIAEIETYEIPPQS